MASVWETFLEIMLKLSIMFSILFQAVFTILQNEIRKLYKIESSIERIKKKTQNLGLKS